VDEPNHRRGSSEDVSDRFSFGLSDKKQMWESQKREPCSDF
jgi:hypothetical protein